MGGVTKILRCQRGATLIELAIAAGILGILTLAGTVVFQTMTTASLDARRMGQVRDDLARLIGSRKAGSFSHLDLRHGGTVSLGNGGASATRCPAGILDFYEANDPCGTPDTQIVFRTHCRAWASEHLAAPPSSMPSPFKACKLGNTYPGSVTQPGQECWPTAVPVTEVILKRDGVETRRLRFVGTAVCTDGAVDPVDGTANLRIETMSADRKRVATSEIPLPTAKSARRVNSDLEVRSCNVATLPEASCL